VLRKYVLNKLRKLQTVLLPERWADPYIGESFGIAPLELATYLSAAVSADEQLSLTHFQVINP
jgi:hypothetical protein